MVVFWVSFLILVAVLLALDLGVFHKKDKEIGVKEALTWTFIWVACSLAFNVFIYFFKGHNDAFDFLTGYIIEKTLSLDNIFVIAAIFSFFKIPNKYQHRVLFWGIIGAVVLRGICIAGGAILVQNFSWILYIFGVLLIVSAIKMLFGDEDTDIEKNFFVRLARKVLPISMDLNGHDFTVKKDGKRFFTPLFLALVVIEGSDVLFAADSIPAIFGITQDPFIVFTSNIMAILGLRSLYFALAAMLKTFDKLKYAVSFILCFIGIKMLIADFYHIDSLISLCIIAGAILLAILASLISKKK